MIGYLSGTIIAKNEKEITLNVNGVGYKVACPLPTILACEVNSQKDLLIHTRVREDAITLYGFETGTDLEIFEKLLDVSGIGPRSALAMLSVHSPSSIAEAVEKGDVTLLTHTPGLGKKSAEKIIIELKGKLSHLQTGEKNESTVEVRLALEALGYTQKEIFNTVNKLNTKDKDTNTLIKEALNQLK